MKKVIVFGSTGNLGKQILLELKWRNYAVIAVVRNNTKAEEIKAIAADFKIADVMQPASLAGICNGYDIVISS